ncbi:MAG: T9SS type A sorting domain-containing protein [Bacteroidales bacterium]|nr:T9SS type A sorting domain-containing protein [Bacteroidales bacterium]
MKKLYTNFSGLFKNLAAGILLLTGLAPIGGQAQSITLLAPNGGEIWNGGTYEEVSWTGQDLGSILRLEISNDGGNEWFYFGELSSAPNGGIAPVFVPNVITTNALLRITDFFNPAVSDISDAPFSITFSPINIYQPATGSFVFANVPTYVNWLVNDPDITLINAEISTDNGLTYVPVAQNINALTGFTYLILSETATETCILRLSNAADPSEFSVSTPFTISTVPVYNLTSPAGGEIVNVYSPVTISWTVENSFSDDCNLEYSTDNGETWTFLNNATSTGTFGSYVWTTPNLNSETCLIRISDIYSQTSKDTSGVFTIMPFPEIQPCMVTVDSLTNHNIIVWERPESGLINDFLVYRETTQANVYEVIDTVGYDEEPVVSDFDSNPAVRPYRYKIGFLDNENRVFPAGDYHQTIHLTISQGVSGNWNLIWTPYTGFDYSSYNILRKTGSGSYEQIATISSSFNSYTDFEAPSEEVSYIVAIDRPGACNTGSRSNNYSDVRSNVASLSPVGIAGNMDVDFSIYPVPANDRINLQFDKNLKGTILLTITDITGRIIFSADYSGVPPGQVHSVSTSEYKEGIYLLNVISEESRSTKKIVVRH